MRRNADFFLMGQILRFCTLLIPNLLLIPSKEKGKYSLGCMLRKKNSFDDQLAAFATDTESQTLKYCTRAKIMARRFQ